MGGELAAITSQGEEAYVTSWLDDQIGEQDSEVFLGGSDADVEDTWTWSSGETWDYENWYVGEPNNQNGDEDYLQLTHNSVINWDWKWNDFDGNGADATYYMLIEAADTSSMPTGVVITAATDSDGDGLADIVEIQTYGTDPNDADSDDDSLSDGYEVMNTYELIIGSFDPSSAASDANNRGGYLATITSTQEWNYIQSLITTNITYWLGGNDVAAEGQWVWNNGEVWAVEFWDDANPSNSGNAEHYLTAVHNNSQNSWNDTESFYSLSYLLEVNKLTTNPNDADSDDDGLSDGDEIANGTNPNIAESSGTVPINSWEQLGDIISNSGQPDGNAPHPQRISLSKDGNRFAVSDTSSGVSVYQLSNGSWIQVGQSISTGVYTAKVALSDGSTLICGVGNLDQASVYQFVDDSWSQVGATLIGSSGGYGSGVGISDDGGIIAVGDWLDDEAGENAGKVTIYQFVDGEWSQLGNSILGKYAGDQSARRALDLSSNGYRVAIGNYGSSVPNGYHSEI